MQIFFLIPDQSLVLDFHQELKYFLMSTDELISAPKITIFLPQLPPDYESCERTLNPIP